jgi:hypothetical protein
MGVSWWRGSVEPGQPNGPRDPMHPRSGVRLNLPVQVNGAGNNPPRDFAYFVVRRAV